MSEHQKKRVGGGTLLSTMCAWCFTTGENLVGGHGGDGGGGGGRGGTHFLSMPATVGLTATHLQEFDRL